MKQVGTQHIKKQLNELGLIYESAIGSKKLQFKEALEIYADEDGTDYWRGFRDVWKYSATLGKAPYAILVCAKDVLGFNYKPTLKK